MKCINIHLQSNFMHGIMYAGEKTKRRGTRHLVFRRDNEQTSAKQTESAKRGFASAQAHKWRRKRTSGGASAQVEAQAYKWRRKRTQARHAVPPVHPYRGVLYCNPWLEKPPAGLYRKISILDSNWQFSNTLY
jgi:hypothetical protein